MSEDLQADIDQLEAQIADLKAQQADLQRKAAYQEYPKYVKKIAPSEADTPAYEEQLVESKAAHEALGEGWV